MSRVIGAVVGLVIGAIAGAVFLDRGPGLDLLVVAATAVGALAGFAIGSLVWRRA